MSRYQKCKTNLDFTVARDSEWQWHQLGHTKDKSAPCSRQITTPAPHHSVFYRPDALPVAQPTASMHWRENTTITEIKTTSWRQVDQAEILVCTHTCTDTHTKEHTDWKTGKKIMFHWLTGWAAKEQNVKMLRRPFIFWLYSCKIWLLTLIDSPICTWWLVELFTTKTGNQPITRAVFY